MANRLGYLDWKVEYEFKERFGLDGMSAASFEALATRLLAHEEEPAVQGERGGSLWQVYKGQGDGSLYCKGYTSATSPFPPIYPCKTCTGDCQRDFVSYLNASALKP